MSVVKYVLNSDGTIPSVITNGGYFAVDNSNEWPMNLDLVGIATDPNDYEKFNTQNDLEQYLIEKSIDWKNPDNTPFNSQYNAQWLWNQQ